MKLFFRMLLVFSIVVYLFYYITPLFDDLWLDEYQIGLLLNNGAEATFYPSIYLDHLLAVTWVASSVGMMFFNNLFRALFTLLVVATTIMIPFLGWVVRTPIEEVAVVVLNIVDGILLALAYFSPLAREFNMHIKNSLE